MKRNNKIVRACTGLPWVDFFKLARRLAYETKLEEGKEPGQELIAAVDAEFCPTYTRHRLHRAMDNDTYIALSTRTKRHIREIDGREVWVDGTEEIRNQRSYLGGFGRIFAGLVGVEPNVLSDYSDVPRLCAGIARVLAKGGKWAEHQAHYPHGGWQAIMAYWVNYAEEHKLWAK